MLVLGAAPPVNVHQLVKSVDFDPIRFASLGHDFRFANSIIRFASGSKFLSG